MRRRVAIVLGVAFAASGISLTAAPPAAATDVCGFTAIMHTGSLVYPVTVQPGLTLVTVHQPRTVGFGIALPVGTCVSSDGTLTKTFTAGGTMTGWCGHSSGQGTANDGANFAWVQVGNTMVVTGHIVGTLTVTPNPTIPANDCLTGAKTFIVAGNVVLLHCTVLTSSLVTMPIPPTLTLVIPGTLSVHTGPMTYHSSLCLPGPL